MADLVRRSFSGITPTTTTISGSLSAGATTLTLSSATGWPTTTAGPFTATISLGDADEEQIEIGTRSGTSCSNIVRGANGTTDQLHAANASIRHTSGKRDYDEANLAVAETVGKVAAKGDLLAGDGANSLGAVTVGANATVLVADSAQSEGIAWVAMSGDATIATTGVVTIASGAVENSMMAANSVDSDQYVDGSIDLVHMSANSVDSDQYVDGSIDLVHMSANSVDSDQYVDGSIDTAHYAAGSVDTTALGADAVDGDKIADDAVDSEHIAAGAIDAAHIATGVLPLHITFTRPGTLVTGTGTMRWRAPVDLTLLHVRLACGTAPTGAAILVDVHKNGTTVFTTQGNRPTIAISAFAETAIDAPDVTALDAGDYLTVDIDQIGSTIAGADLAVTVYAVAA